MTDHLEGALSDADAERMRAHLAGCEACRVYLDQLRATIEIVRGVGPSEEFRSTRSHRLTCRSFPSRGRAVIA